MSLIISSKTPQEKNCVHVKINGYAVDHCEKFVYKFAKRLSTNSDYLNGFFSNSPDRFYLRFKIVDHDQLCIGEAICACEISRDNSNLLLDLSCPQQFPMISKEDKIIEVSVKEYQVYMWLWY